MNNARWYEFYKNNRGLTPSNIILHWQYLLKIMMLKPRKILEIGCGTADHSIFFSKLFPDLQISLLDYEKKILERIKMQNNRINKFYHCDLLDKKNIGKNLNESFFDVIYSQGLMEHYNKISFKKIIINLLPYTNTFIFSVPSEFYPNKDFGNELLRNKKQLTSIISSITGINFRISFYFPDIGYRTKIVRIKKDKMNIFQAIFFLLFGSCHYLIEITKIV